MLARAAAVLDARGIIVWMGAGEELFPALSYGYDERVIERLGPIPRGASNATAEAWRTARMRTVAADAMSHGAIAAPVSGIGGCVGVFAAEVRHGREDDPGTQAVAAMIAAQLAGIVSAWPAARCASGNVRFRLNHRFARLIRSGRAWPTEAYGQGGQQPKPEVCCFPFFFCCSHRTSHNRSITPLPICQRPFSWRRKGGTPRPWWHFRRLRRQTRTIS